MRNEKPTIFRTEHMPLKVTLLVFSGASIMCVASAVDPLARMNLHSDSYRAMTTSIRDAADRLYQGRLVVVHEGGYSETYFPFCGHALVEALSGETSDVVDPLLEMALLWQPAERFNALQFQILDEMAASLNFGN